MSKDLKNKIDSIRRTLKNNGLEIPSAEIENKILELYPNYQEDWCTDARTEVIKSIQKDHQTSDIISTIATPLTPPSPTEIQHNQEAETLTQQEIEEESRVGAIALPEEEEPGHAIAPVEKADLVASTAYSMGIQLQISEVKNIADNLRYFGDSFEEGLEEIKSAIIAFVDYDRKIKSQKVNRAVNDIRHIISDSNAETSAQFDESMRTIAADLNQGETDFKSQVKNISGLFAIPTSKAG